MQQASHTSSNALTATCFDLDSYEAFAQSDEFPATLVVTLQTPEPGAATLSTPVLPSVCLSLLPPQKRLEHWRLVLVRGVAEALTPNHIIGAAIQIAKGRTSPIACIDPATRRVRTITGSIYELGTPDPHFYRTAPDVVRYLGF